DERPIARIELGRVELREKLSLRDGLPFVDQQTFDPPLDVLGGDGHLATFNPAAGHDRGLRPPRPEVRPQHSDGGGDQQGLSAVRLPAVASTGGAAWARARPATRGSAADSLGRGRSRRSPASADILSDAAAARPVCEREKRRTERQRNADRAGHDRSTSSVATRDQFSTLTYVPVCVRRRKRLASSA